MGMKIAKQGRATAEQSSAPKNVRTGLRAEEIAAALIDNLHCIQGKQPQHATRNTGTWPPPIPSATA
jgi:hypothetical protein